jgi:hypothetical protein
MTAPALILGAFAALVGLWRSSRMIRQPNTYLGTGAAPATDSRTVRQFGIAGAVGSSVVLVLILISLII